MPRKLPTEYTKEFQDAAVERTKQPGSTVSSVARELVIHEWKLNGWVKKNSERLERSPDSDEYKKLKDENRRLKEEQEILKKAAAYFAKAQF